MADVKTLKELEERAIVFAKMSDSLGILGGHFPLNKSGNPELDEDNTFGIFPLYTFELACKLANEAKSRGKESKLILVVDDHSLVIPRNWYSQSNRGTQADEIRRSMEKYFKSFQFPQKYKDIMSAQSIAQTDFLWATPSCLPYQESRFREDFEIKNQGLAVGCAGEYRLILRDIAGRGIKNLLAFIPLRCQCPTSEGIEGYNLIAQSEGVQTIRAVQAYLPTDRSINTTEQLREEIEKTGIPIFEN